MSVLAVFRTWGVGGGVGYKIFYCGKTAQVILIFLSQGCVWYLWALDYYPCDGVVVGGGGDTFVFVKWWYFGGFGGIKPF